MVWNISSTVMETVFLSYEVLPLLQEHWAEAPRASQSALGPQIPSEQGSGLHLHLKFAEKVLMRRNFGT